MIRKMKKKSTLLLMSIALSSSAHALEIDERLTLRLLNVSASQRTVLTNRGAEDGLVVGDHAKFFITAGVIARGVVEKVSPTRSVWSIYRIVDSNEMVKDKVLNIKISTPAKITDDPTKTLQEKGVLEQGIDTTITSRGDDMMGMSDESAELTEFDQTAESPAQRTRSKKNVDPEIKKLNDIPLSSSVTSYGSLSHRSWEVYATAYVNSFSGETTSDTEQSSYDSGDVKSSQMSFTLGVEKYFLNTSGFFRNVSLFGFLNKKTIESGSDVYNKSDWLDYGLGVNYHFYNRPDDINALIGYGTASFGLGSVTDTSSVYVSGSLQEQELSGSSNFFAVGVGMKYLMRNGVGLRAVLDYYTTSQEVTIAEEVVTTKLSGPRIQMGLSYRF